MKRLFAISTFFLLIFSALMALAQDTGADIYPLQANRDCDTFLTVQTDPNAAQVDYFLRIDSTVVESGRLGADQVVDLKILPSDQWYTLLIERSEADQTHYWLNNRLECPQTPPITQASWQILAAMMFARDHWTQADIDWLYGTYAQLGGSVEEYVYAQATGYAIYDAAASATPAPGPTARP